MATRGHLVMFKLNRGTVRKFAVSPQVRDMVTEHVDLAKTFAETLSTGLRSNEKHQHYQDSFQTEVLKVRGWPPRWPMTRWGARLFNTSEHANFVEFGTVRTTKSGEVVETTAYHILGRTVDFMRTLSPPRDGDGPE